MISGDRSSGRTPTVELDGTAWVGREGIAWLHTACDVLRGRRCYHAWARPTHLATLEELLLPDGHGGLELVNHPGHGLAGEETSGARHASVGQQSLPAAGAAAQRHGREGLHSGRHV